MLGADELVLEPFASSKESLENFIEPRCHVGLCCAPGYLGEALERLFDLPLDRSCIGPELLQGGRNNPLGLSDQGRKQMLHIYGLMAELTGQGLGFLDGFLNFQREFVKPHCFPRINF